MPVAPLLEEKTYLPQENATFDGLALESVHGERYATGVYLCATFTAPDGMTKEEAMDVLHTLSICDADGALLPMGLSLSIWPDAEALPVVTLEVPASLEALPDEVTVVGGETIVSSEMTCLCRAAAAARLFALIFRGKEKSCTMKRIIAITCACYGPAAVLCRARPAHTTRPLRFLVNDNGEAAAWLKEHVSRNSLSKPAF